MRKLKALLTGGVVAGMLLFGVVFTGASQNLTGQNTPPVGQVALANNLTDAAQSLDAASSSGGPTAAQN